MATEKRYLYGPVEMSFLSNQTLDVFFETMVYNGVLDEEQVKELRTYRAVVAQKGFFGRLISDNLFHKDKDGSDNLMINIVKVMNDKDED